jgi:hypothetical protein
MASGKQELFPAFQGTPARRTGFHGKEAVSAIRNMPKGERMKKSLLAASAFLFLGTAALQGCFVGWHNHDRHHRRDGFHDGDRRGDHDRRGDYDRSRGDDGHRRGND